MENAEINVNLISSHLIELSDKDFNTMINLLKTKDYHWALFVGHLVIENLLKSIIVVKTKKHAPFTHDSRKLSKITALKFSSQQVKWLDGITTFNLNARYNDYKQEFYKKCIKEFSTQWINNIKILRLWIKEQL